MRAVGRSRDDADRLAAERIDWAGVARGKRDAAARHAVQPRDHQRVPLDELLNRTKQRQLAGRVSREPGRGRHRTIASAQPDERGRHPDLVVVREREDVRVGLLALVELAVGKVGAPPLGLAVEREVGKLEHRPAGQLVAAPPGQRERRARIALERLADRGELGVEGSPADPARRALPRLGRALGDGDVHESGRVGERPPDPLRREDDAVAEARGPPDELGRQRGRRTSRGHRRARRSWYSTTIATIAATTARKR